jgi:hypothetical protein
VRVKAPKARSIPAWREAPGRIRVENGRAESPFHKLIGRAFSPFYKNFIIPSASHWAGIERAFGAQFELYGDSNSRVTRTSDCTHEKERSSTKNGADPTISRLSQFGKLKYRRDVPDFKLTGNDIRRTSRMLYFQRLVKAEYFTNLRRTFLTDIWIWLGSLRKFPSFPSTGCMPFKYKFSIAYINSRRNFRIVPTSSRFVFWNNSNSFSLMAMRCAYT